MSNILFHICGKNAFIFLVWQQNFNFITHFHKDHEQEIFLFDLTGHFCQKCGIKKINIVIYYLPPLTNYLPLV